jgi:acyl dehydratase
LDLRERTGVVSHETRQGFIRMPKRYLEDFVVGQTFSSGRWRVTKEQIKAFAAEFDPQPFHLDALAAHSWCRGETGLKRLLGGLETVSAQRLLH